MVHATQTLFTCDRCGVNVTGPLRTRKQPDGWQTVEMVMPPDQAVVQADLCTECVASLMGWWTQLSKPARQ